jgi:hypothetical protein
LTQYLSPITLASTRYDAAASLAASAEESADDEREHLPSHKTRLSLVPFPTHRLPDPAPTPDPLIPPPHREGHPSIHLDTLANSRMSFPDAGVLQRWRECRTLALSGSLAPHVQNFTLTVFCYYHQDVTTMKSLMNQSVRESCRPGFGACTLRETCGRSHGGPRFSKAMGAAGSSLE